MIVSIRSVTYLERRRLKRPERERLLLRLRSRDLRKQKAIVSKDTKTPRSLYIQVLANTSASKRCHPLPE